MQQLGCLGDERTLAFCAFCGGKTDTRDHCPSRVFLDKPYPENLPVVPSCAACNSGFSSDEEYVAFLLSCVLAGSTDPEAILRAKTKRILAERPLLRTRIENALKVSGGVTSCAPESERVAVVVTKLARGHALYELHESCITKPEEVSFCPLPLLSEAHRYAFENPESFAAWPEVGSRAMQRFLINSSDFAPSGWLIVQPDRYRFHAALGNGVEVRIVIHEYLACYVHWEY